MSCCRRLLAAWLLLLHPVAAAAAAGKEGCPAGAACLSAADPGPQYPWPAVRGRAESYSISPHRVPKGWEKTLAWTFPGARGNHSTVFNGGVAIDDERNVYTAAVDCIYKLNEHGVILWLYPVATSTTPMLYKGALYSNSKDGRVFALDMKSGTVIWSSKVCERIGGDIASVGVSDGVVVSSSDSPGFEGDGKVLGLNATSGEVLWTYSAEAQLWNFMPMFTGEGTFVFQDQIGGVYHLETATGKVRWTAGYKGVWTETWSDGVAMVGPNRMVYVVHADCRYQGFSTYPACTPTSPGTVRAYRLDSGELAWSQQTPYSPNSQPVVVKLGKSSKLSVVLPVGIPAGLPPSLMIFGVPYLPMGLKSLIHQFSIWLGDSQTWLWRNTRNPSVVQAYDAETGEKQWSWTPPDLVRGYSAGDEELLIPRIRFGAPQHICIPNLWASPTVDADGKIIVSHANGKIYAFKDDNEDGVIDPPTEVVEYDTEVAFGHPGAGLAEGMMVTVNCDRVLAFKY